MHPFSIGFQAAKAWSQISVLRPARGSATGSPALHRIAGLPNEASPAPPLIRRNWLLHLERFSRYILVPQMG